MAQAVLFFMNASNVVGAILLWPYNLAVTLSAAVHEANAACEAGP
jgi:hypothetical protein